MTSNLLGGALAITIHPRTLKLRVEARRLYKAILDSLPTDDDPIIQSWLESAAADYSLLQAHTAAIVMVEDTPIAKAFMAWWASGDDLLKRFDAFMTQPEDLINEWLLAYKNANDFDLPIESKPPSELTPAERAALDDPKAKATSAAGSGKANS